MINLLASPDTSISADVGNPGFSKTPQGVQASQATLSVDDNHVRKQFERWFERWSETAINLYFAERTGVEELQLDDDTAEQLRALPEFAPAGKNPDGSPTPPGKMADMLSDDDKIRINYSTATPALKFRVSADSSKMSNDPAQVGIATNLLETVMKFPMLNKNFGGRIDVDELAEKIVYSSGIQNPGQIAPELTKEEKAAKLQSRQQPNSFSPAYDKPQIRIDYRDVEDPGARAELLKLAGAPPTAALPPIAPGIAEQAARNTGQAQDTQAQEPQVEQAPPVGPDHILKADQQAHQQEMDKAKLSLDQQKLVLEAQKQAHAQTVAEHQHELAKKQANKPVPKVATKAKAGNSGGR